MQEETRQLAMSTIHLSPYINFQGRAHEAMEFYQKLLGGKLDLYTLSEQGASGPAGRGDRIAPAQLEADGAVIIGSDGHPKCAPTVGDNMAGALGGTDRKRLTGISTVWQNAARSKGV